MSKPTRIDMPVRCDTHTQAPSCPLSNCGPCPYTTACIRVHSLYVMRWRTGAIRAAVTWSRARRSATKRAAAWRTRCKSARVESGSSTYNVIRVRMKEHNRAYTVGPTRRFRLSLSSILQSCEVAEIGLPVPKSTQIRVLIKFVIFEFFQKFSDATPVKFSW